MTVGSATGTTVFYSYEMTDVPKWAESDALKAALYVLAKTLPCRSRIDMAGNAQVTLPITLTNDGWQRRRHRCGKRCRHNIDVRGAGDRRAPRDGNYEGGTACSRCLSVADGFRFVPPLLAPVHGSGS